MSRTQAQFLDYSTQDKRTFDSGDHKSIFLINHLSRLDLLDLLSGPKRVVQLSLVDGDAADARCKIKTANPARALTGICSSQHIQRPCRPERREIPASLSTIVLASL